MENLKVGVLGLGLIGGSILKCLNKKGVYTIAVSKSSHKKACAHSNECSDDISILKNADVVFVCSEMSKTLAVLDELEKVVSEKTIVTDVCSLKEFVCENAQKRPYKFVGSHPMAGTEFSGFENSFAELFEGAKWVLTKENKALEHLISLMGAKTVIMSPKEHDRAVAVISHLPMLLSQALFGTAKNDNNAKILASSGFKDMTRLAMTSPTLASDMLKYNKGNIDKALDGVMDTITHLKKLNYDERIDAFKENAQQRTQMYKDGKNVL